jgi:hypothetical protein
MKKLLSVAAAAAIMSGVPNAYAAQLDVEITNLTNGIWRPGSPLRQTCRPWRKAAISRACQRT